MSRLLLPFLLAVMLAQVTVTIAMAPRTICPEACPDDGPDGRCPPACLGCVSTAHAASPAYATSVAAPALRGEVTPTGSPVVFFEPDPADIFHVPRQTLA
jgi:hypothetical protein